MAEQRSFFSSLAVAILLSVAVPRAAILYTDVNRDSITVGDRIHLRVSMLTPPDAQVVPPEPEQDFGRVVVKDWSVDRDKHSNADSLTYEYLVTVYETGLCTIPALPYYLTTADGIDTLRSRPTPILVASVITTDSASLRDIKSPLTAGRPSFLWLWLILGTGLLVTGIYMISWFRRQAAKPAAPPPPKPPYDEAIEALDALAHKQLPSQGLIREYVFELSEILKRYTSRRYGVNVTDFTTEEILGWVHTSSLEREQQKVLEWFFLTSHPIKFARLVPDRDTTERFMVEVRGFVEATRPQPKPAEAPAQATEETA